MSKESGIQNNLEFIQVASIDEIPPGERLLIEIDHTPIVLFNIAGSLFALLDICSHGDAPLGEGDLENEFEISCPRHGAHFDVRTGKALTYPAVKDVQSFPVRLIGRNIEIGFPNP